MMKYSKVLAIFKPMIAKKNRWKIIFLSIVTVSTALVLYFLSGYIANLAGRLMINLATVRSNDQYELQFDDIKLSLETGELQVSDIKLINKNPRNEQTAYAAHISDAKFELTSLWGLVIYKELVFKSITLTDPTLSIDPGTEREEKLQFSFETGNVISLIKDYFELFQIDSLALTNGAVNIEKEERAKKSFFTNIDFFISEFYIGDSTSDNQNQFMFSDDIKLVVTNQSFDLKDDVHQLGFSSCEFSTKSKNLLFKEVFIQPRDSVELKDDQITIDVHIPELNFRGIDFQTAYEENRLILDSVRMWRPLIAIGQAREKQQVQAGTIGAFISQLFKDVSVRKLYLDQAHFELNSLDSNDPTFRSEELSIEWSDFYYKGDSLLSWPVFKDVELQALQSTLHLKEQSGVIQLNQLHVSTSTHKLRYEGLEINKPGTTTIFVNGKSQSGEVTGFMLEKLIAGNFSIDTLKVNNSAFDIRLPKRLNGKQENKLPFSMHYMDLKQVDLNITQDTTAVELIGMNMLVSNLQPLFQNVKRVALPTVKGSVDGWRYATPQIKLEGEELIWDRSKYIASNQVQIETPKLQGTIAMVEIIQPLFQPKQKSGISFQSDTIKLFEPNFEVPVLTSGGRNPPKFPTNHLEIINGHLHVSELVDIQGVDIHISKIINELDSISFDYWGALSRVQLDTQDIDLQLISFSSRDSTLMLDSISIQLPDKEGRLRQFHGSDFSLAGLNYQQLIRHKHLIFKNGKLEKYMLDWTISPNKAALPKITFDQFDWTNGQFQIRGDSGLDLSFRSPSTQLLGFTLDSISSWKSLAGAFEDLTFKSKEDSLMLKRLNFSDQTGRLIMDELYFQSSDKLEIGIPNIYISGLATYDLIHEPAKQFDTIKVVAPNIMMDLEKMKRSPNKSVLPILKSKLFWITQGEVQLNNTGVKANPQLDFHELAFMARNFSLDSTMKENPLGPFQDFTLSGKDVAYSLGDEYDLKLDAYSINSSDRQITLDGIELKPRYSRNQFQKRLQYQADWFRGTLDQMVFSGFDLPKSIKEKHIYCDKIQVTTLSLDTHRDKRLPPIPNRTVPFPTKQLAELPIGVSIDTIRVRNSYISHSEFSPTGTLPGLIYFKQLNAEVFNIHSQATINRPLRIKANGTLMETGDFSLDITFDAEKPQEEFIMRGSIGPMELTDLNSFLVNTNHVEIRNGTSKQVQFKANANQQFASGEMLFHYQHLKISVLKEKLQENKNQGAGLKTFFANTFVVNTKNPKWLISRKGDIFTEHDDSKSIINYWAKIILSGAVSSIGAQNNKREIREKAKEVMQQLETDTMN